MEEAVKMCDEFSYFSFLPTEIRLKIWKLSILDTPRLLPLPAVPGLLVSRVLRD